MSKMTKRGGAARRDQAGSRDMPPIGCYVRDDYARAYHVQAGAGDPHYRSRRRSYWPWLMALLIIAGGLLFGFHRHMRADQPLMHELSRFAGRALELVRFPIEQVHIAGHQQTGEKEIIEKLGDIWEQSLLSLNTSVLQKRIEALPWVREAIVERVFPHGLNVYVKERAAIGRWVTLDGRYVFDREGVVIEAVKVGTRLDLAMFEGAGAPGAAHELLAALDQFQKLNGRFKRFAFVDQRRWTMFLGDGTRVLLPENDIISGLSRLDTLQARNNILSRDLALIDLRLGDRVTIRPKRSQRIKILSTLEDLPQQGKIVTDSVEDGDGGI